MEQISWNSLPSLVLLEVFTYLSQQDKINASSTCKHWRSTLFHTSFLPSVHFKIRTNDANSISRTRFLTSCFAKKLRNATVTIDSSDPTCVHEGARVLKQLVGNIHLRKLIFKPSHCNFAFRGKSYSIRYLLAPLLELVRYSPSLEVLNLGFSQELTSIGQPLLDSLQRCSSCSISQIGLASVKENPDDYNLLDLDATVFCSFQRLQVLSIDYDEVTDSLLSSLERMKRLVVNVHNFDNYHPGTTDDAWSDFTQLNPSCELRINLIRSWASLDRLDTHILKQTMPLTHLQIFFCQGLNVHALDLLPDWYANSLRSLWLVDLCSEDVSGDFSSYVDPELPDPLVMAAWSCTQLEEIVLLGYKYSGYDIQGIARLRGPKLKRFDILERDIARPYSNENLLLDVSTSLERTWAPLDNSQLHKALTHPLDNSPDEYILSVLTL